MKQKRILAMILAVASCLSLAVGASAVNALLVLFFVIGVMKTCGSFTELKRPEVAFKCFIRFVLAQAAVTYGMELMTALFSIAQGAIQTIMGASGLTAMEASTLPAEIASTIEDVGLLESIPLWAVTLLGSLFIWVLSLVMILTVYGRFFKLYMATAIAPIPLSSFAGQQSCSIGILVCSRQALFVIPAHDRVVQVLPGTVCKEITDVCVVRKLPADLRFC